MRLTSLEYQELQTALVSAFPSQQSLKQMVRLQLELNLEKIAGNESYGAVVFNLIEWAESEGKLEELINQKDPKAIVVLSAGIDPSYSLIFNQYASVRHFLCFFLSVAVVSIISFLVFKKYERKIAELI